MNRYGYTDTKAEGAVGGSTDFVGFQLRKKQDSNRTDELRTGQCYLWQVATSTIVQLLTVVI